jgi:hypothetical protein
MGVIEINPSNKKYTWSNNQDNLILAKLDRIFATIDWEAVVPLVRVTALPKDISDHNPLLIDFGYDISFGKKKFRFQKWWLERGDVKEIVVKVWTSKCLSNDPMERWQSKIRTFRRLVRGWVNNVIPELNKEKQRNIAEYNLLDEEADGRVLENHEKERMKFLAREVEKMWCLEEIRARQRARDKDILKGDRSTTYFQAVANHRNRKKRIDSLRGSDGLVHDTHSILKVAASYYRELFRKEDRDGVSLSPNFWEADRVTSEERALLEAPFLEPEVKAAVFSCYPEEAPGPDGLPFLFYQKYWEVIKNDFMLLVGEFQAGKLDIFRINFAMITLILKVAEATDMRNFRPISLLNYSFKIFGKLFTIRLEKIGERLIAKEQNAFIRGRYILESVVIAHEMVHSLHRSGEPGVIIKLDYEKAYDRVNIEFFCLRS